MKAALQELLRGKGAHVDPVSCVEGLSLQVATAKIAGYPHAIAQIVGHMNYWMEYELKRMAGERPAYPEHAIESWPADGSYDEGKWKAEAARFASLLEKFGDLAKWDDGRLDRPVEKMHTSEGEATVREVLWQMMAHNSYHVGQVAMLRRCLGAWPVRGGGDTW